MSRPFEPNLLGLPGARVEIPESVRRRRVVLAALHTQGTVADVAARTGFTPAEVNQLIACLRRRIRIVEKRRVTDRPGRVFVNVYVRREVGN